VSCSLLQICNCKLFMFQQHRAMHPCLPKTCSSWCYTCTTCQAHQNRSEHRPLHLQATVTKAVLPLWSYHKLPKCSFRITRQVISILTDCTTGTAAATTALNRVATVSRPVAAPDPAMVQTIVDMGFSRARVEDTLRRVRPSTLIRASP